MKQALGLVEIQGMSTAVVVADTMVKAANIRIIDMENTKGLGYMTIKIAGDVGAVNAAVNAGRQVGMLHGRLVSSKVIPRPSDYVEQTFCNPEPPAEPEPEPETKLEKPDTIEVSESEPKPEQVEEPAAIAPESPADPELTGADPEQPELKKRQTGKGTAKTAGTPKNNK